ncbi:hypothetical protein Tco_0424696 [Tanacetum coccineum]
MSTYLKHMGGYTYKQLKGKSFDEIQKLFDKEMKRVNTFVVGFLRKISNNMNPKEENNRMEEDKESDEVKEVSEDDEGSGPRCQDTILGDVNAQTRFEITSKQSNDPPLSRGYTLGSGEDSMKQLELMELFNAARLMLMLPV